MNVAHLAESQDVVLWSWCHRGESYRTFSVQAIPRLEVQIHRAWVMIDLQLDAAAILHAYVACFAAGLRFEQRAGAEVRAAEANAGALRLAQWGRIVPRVQSKIALLPEPWNGKKATR